MGWGKIITRQSAGLALTFLRFGASQRPPGYNSNRSGLIDTKQSGLAFLQAHCDLLSVMDALSWWQLKTIHAPLDGIEPLSLLPVPPRFGRD